MKRLICVSLAVMISMTIVGSPRVIALTVEQKRLYDEGIYYYNHDKDTKPVSTGGGDCAGGAAPAITDQSKVASAIDSFILSHGGAGSPFDGLGAHIVAGAVRAGVNPFLIVAIALQESSFGTAGVATNGSNNAFGRTAGSGQPNIPDGSRLWYKWNSWIDSVDATDNNDEPSYIRDVYLSDPTLKTVKDIIFKYAPPGDGGNDSDAYAKNINDWMNELITSSGSGLSCGSGGAGAPGAPANPTGNVALGKQIAATYGWGDGAEWDCLYNLFQNESGWNEKASNPSSGAYGIPQALPGNKMESIASDWLTNPATQIKWGLEYIKGRPDYGTPCAAWDLWQRRDPHWY